MAVSMHACILATLVASGVCAESSALAERAQLASELLWFERARVGVASASLLPVAARATASGAVSSPAPSALALRRGRYRTMRVAGYLSAATAAALSLAAIPLLRTRKEHVSFYGEEACGRNLFPYLAAPTFAFGLGVGVTGSVLDRALRRAHGPIGPVRTPWRAALAGVGVGLTMATLASTLGLSTFCSS